MTLAPRRNVGKIRLTTSKAVRRERGRQDTPKLFWSIDCEPHVRVRLKRLFGKLDVTREGTLVLTATPETSRDLEWVLERYPMELHPDAARHLEGMARHHDQVLADAWAIMSGSYAPPDFTMALPPRPYQALAAALALKVPGLLLADELGLGKTVAALALISEGGALPAMVVVPAHLPGQWAREIARFLPGLRVHIARIGKAYELDADGPFPDVLVISYHKLDGWQDYARGVFHTVIFDECQELRRPDSMKYRAARHIADGAKHRLGLSGTPIFNYGVEFHAVLDVLAPGALGSQDEFVREWCVTNGGERRKARIKEPQVFGNYLREQGLMLRRTRQDVAVHLPPCSTIVHEVDADTFALEAVGDSAAELARVILDRTGARRGFEIMKASSEFSGVMRQATGIAKAPYVAAFVELLLKQGTPVVLFGWHREVYSIWAHRLREHDPAWYTGSESPAKKEAEVRRFLDGETNLIMVSLRSGAGLDGLQRRCSTVVFGELDWSPGAMEQCIGRVFRSGQESPVFVYYLTADAGCDPIMVDVLGLKRGQLEGVRDPEGRLVETLEVDPDHVRKLAEDFIGRREGAR